MKVINSQLTEEEIEQLIKDADSDKDGLISYEGRQMYISHLTPPSPSVSVGLFRSFVHSFVCISHCDFPKDKSPIFIKFGTDFKHFCPLAWIGICVAPENRGALGNEFETPKELDWGRELKLKFKG